MTESLGPWIHEVEIKYDGVYLSAAEAALRIAEEKGAQVTRLASGLHRTYWLNQGLPKGTSARVRLSLPANSRHRLSDRFVSSEIDDESVGWTATLKLPSPDDPRGRVVHAKAKLENNRQARSFREANEILVEGARSLNLIAPSADLTRTLIVNKQRTSFSTLLPDAFVPIRVDADHLYSYSRPVQPEDSFTPIDEHLTELEHTGPGTARAKEKIILASGESLGFPLAVAFAPLNTRNYLSLKQHPVD